MDESMLTGDALLAKVKKMRDADRDEMIRACGYCSGDRLRRSAFYQALIDAKGVSIVSSRRPGRPLPYRCRVLGNGQLLVGAAYTREIGLQPGDTMEISTTGRRLTLRVAA